MLLCPLSPNYAKVLNDSSKLSYPSSFFIACLIRVELHRHTASHSCPVCQHSREVRYTGKVKFTGALEEPPVRCFYVNSDHVGRALSPPSLPRETADIIAAYHGPLEEFLASCCCEATIQESFFVWIKMTYIMLMMLIYKVEKTLRLEF